ncbi:uncharacterized protein LOC143034345 [Oratosquilla oratoria]|uniref:uncharacterized protein LOC143034345 n=1 Tax=Oratosquilla oratoria TaxID=337810 RepID=UPI003F76EB79
MRFLSFLLGLACVAFAQGFSKCRCGLFTNRSFGESLVYELPGIDVGSCESHFQCKTLCQNEFRDMTNNGDMYHMLDDGITSIGQFLCEKYGRNLENEYIYNYYELCNGPWEYAEQHSMQPLCCYKGTEYPCSNF